MSAAKVNLDLLHKLLRDNKGAFKKALELFVETTEDDMELLGAQIRNMKYPEASRVAHSLKSRFVYLGNEELNANIKRLELLLKESSVDVINRDAEMLYKNINQTIFFCLHELNAEIRALND